MNEEVEFILDSAKEHMDNAVAHLKKELANIRAGKASPAMLRSIMVDYYGSQTPLSQVANINTPDARTISVQPWEKNMLQEIEKAIMVANIGFNPMNNGESIIINVPVLTEERRKELAKQAKSEAEDDKVGMVNIDKDEFEANKDNYRATVLPSRTLNGETTNCFNVELIEEETDAEYCFTLDGIMLFVKAVTEEGDVEMTATEFSRTVSDADMTPPEVE